MASNRKAATPKEAPQEPFKRTVAGAMRAMAKRAELEVTFSPERAALLGADDKAKARLPEPPRKLTAHDAAIVRGHADAISLRLACHDEAIHRRVQPQSPDARAAFDALRAGARRIDRLAPHGRRRRQYRRHARRSL